MDYIRGCKVPGKRHCMSCLFSEPVALKCRNWSSIKYYVNNRIVVLRKKYEIWASRSEQSKAVLDLLLLLNCRMLVYFSVSLCSHFLSRNRPVPLTLIQGVISNILPFVMSQQGWTNLVVLDIARAIYLIKTESASVYVLFMFLLLYNTRPNPLVRWEEGSTAKEHVSKLLLTESMRTV